MRVRKADRTCYVCGAPATTEDHLPPECVFLKPLPTNRIAVPSCKAHNNDRSKDDEYFRLVMVTICAGADDQRAEQLLDGPVSRGLKRRPDGLLRRFLRGSIDRITVRSPGGIILEEKPGFRIEADRVQLVIDRIVRAIYYREYGTALPPDCPIAGYRTYFPDTPPNRQLVSGMNRKFETDNGGDFFYRMARVESDPTTTMMLMIFYRRLLILTGSGSRNPFVTNTGANIPKQEAEAKEKL